ncbi:MAG: MFS transporter [Candidatus Helarchaeota archaeon]|nr:MFS transporter [Candidatus Helarchaeota archaeon]
MANGTLSSRTAYMGILLFGIVSLVGDIIYEGARGLVPDYLYFLGASALIVGLIGGLGEFLGYAVRLISGYLADNSRAYWLFIFIGYGLIVAIPLLGFVGVWQIAIIFVLFERLGKAIRAPSRDTVLSIVSKGVGPGKAFGLHELLDQIGAVAGPLIVAAIMLFSGNNYQLTFSFLFLPFLVMVIALIINYRKTGPITIPPKTPGEKIKLQRPFYIYTLAVVLNTIGLIPVVLILYKAATLLPPEQAWIVPLIYVLIQGVDAAVALIAGYSYDKFGVKVLTVAFILSIFPPLFMFVEGGLSAILIASVFFGIVLGMQESIYRAAVTQFAPISSRGTAYGIFNTGLGVGFLISGGIFGLLYYNIDLTITILFVVILQVVATIILIRVHQAVKRNPIVKSE